MLVYVLRLLSEGELNVSLTSANCCRSLEGGEQPDVPQDGHARGRGHAHAEEGSVELHPVSLRHTVSVSLSLTHTSARAPPTDL